jgi:TRAP-type mannitol/chloroaromatic compound transport system permease small subunit
VRVVGATLRTFLLSFTRGIDATTKVLGQMTWWASLAMVLVGVENVIARYGYQWIRRTFGDNVAAALSNNTYLEAQTALYNFIFLVGAAYVLQVDGHVRVDIIFSRLRSRTKALIDVVFTVLFLLPFCWMGIYFGNTYVMRSWTQLEFSPNPGGLPRYPIKTLIIVAFALLIVQAASQLIKHIAFLRGVPGSGSHYEGDAGPTDDEGRSLTVRPGEVVG